MTSLLRSRTPDLALVALAVTAAVLSVTGGPQVLRALTIGVLLVVGPGLALVRVLGVTDALTGAVVAVGVSLSLSTGAATAQLYARLWDPQATVVALAGATILLAGRSASVRSPRTGRPKAHVHVPVHPRPRPHRQMHSHRRSAAHGA